MRPLEQAIKQDFKIEMKDEKPEVFKCVTDRLVVILLLIYWQFNTFILKSLICKQLSKKWISCLNIFFYFKTEFSVFAQQHFYI